MKPLGKAATRVLCAMRARVDAGHRMPTLKELARESGVSRGHVVRCLSRLVIDGYLRSVTQGLGYALTQNGDTSGKSESVEAVRTA